MMKKIIAILAFVCLSTVANASNLAFTINAGANIGSGSLVKDAVGLATSGSLVLTSGLVGIYSLYAYTGSPAQKISPFRAFIYNNMTYNGAAADLGARFQDARMRVQARKRGEERRMDVEHALAVALHESRRQHAHEPGQRHQLRRSGYAGDRALFQPKCWLRQSGD